MLRRNPLEFIKKLRLLSRAEVSFAARAWALAPLVEASLAMRGLRPTLRWLEARFPQGGEASVTTPSVERAQWLVDNVYRFHALGGLCLPRSLVQYALLRRAGRDVRFVIGVDRCPSERIKAHAWVQAADAPEDTAAPFQPLMVAGL